MISTTKKMIKLTEKAFDSTDKALNKSLDLVTTFSDPSHPTTKKMSRYGQISGVVIVLSGVALSAIRLKWGIGFMVAGTTTIVSNSIIQFLGKKE